MASLWGLGTKTFDTTEHLAGLLEYIRSKLQPICHISHLSSTATHLAAGAATHLAAAACISSFNYADLQAFIKRQVSTSTIPAKVKVGLGK